MAAIEMVFNEEPMRLYLTDQTGDRGERLWGDEIDAADFSDPLPEQITLAFSRKTAVLSTRGPEPCWRHPGNNKLAARLVDHPVRVE